MRNVAIAETVAWVKARTGQASPSDDEENEDLLLLKEQLKKKQKAAKKAEKSLGRMYQDQMG